MQARNAGSRLTRFQRALAIATELQEVGIAMQKEAGQWRGISKK